MFKKIKEPPAILIAAMITAIAAIIAAVISRQQTVIVLADANATNTSVAATASQAVAILQNTIEAPTLTSLPTQTLYPTYTPYPTYTTVPSPTIPPTPSISLPFSDNFDNGINSYWELITGTWRTVNGRLIADSSNRPSEIIVGDENWRNYIIELNVFSNSAAGFPIGVIVRSMNGKSLMFKTDCCDTDWILIDGASEKTIAHLDQGGLDFTLSGFAINHVRVEVIDQTFIGYIDGKLFLQVTDSTNPTGAVGIMSQTPHENRLLFDNFIVTLP